MHAHGGAAAAEATPRRAAWSPASLYVHERGSVLVPLPFLDLPDELELAGRAWRRKREFHVTAAYVPSIAERIRGPLGIDPERAEAAAWEAVHDVASTYAVGDIELRDEYRRVTRDGDESLIVCCDVHGLDDLYLWLGKRLGTAIEPPPAHVTLYTAGDPGGIGLHTREELERDSVPLGDAEVARLRPAVVAAATKHA